MKLVNFAFLYLCFTLITIVFALGDSEETDRNMNQRAIDYFIVGEKAVGKLADESRDISPLKNLDKISTHSIIDVKLAKGKDYGSFFGDKEFNMILVAELKKKGEDTWSHISAIDRYTREIQKSSQFRDVGIPNDSLVLEPLYVADAILSDNPFVRVGDRVQALFFYDVTTSRVYREDLDSAQRRDKSLMSIDAQEMYLTQIGSTRSRYAARHGDRIRLRFLRAEYSIHRIRNIRYKKSRGEKLQGKETHADLLSIEDEVDFFFEEFGIKLDISPTVVYGSRSGEDFDEGEFNPIDKNPSFGSNVYLSYDGRDRCKKYINILPGLHLSLLGLNSTNEVKFTTGFVWSLPSLRKWVGIFVGLYDLKQWVFGLTFSPSIDFRALVQAERKSE